MLNFDVFLYQNKRIIDADQNCSTVKYIISSCKPCDGLFFFKYPFSSLETPSHWEVDFFKLSIRQRFFKYCGLLDKFYYNLKALLSRSH